MMSLVQIGIEHGVEGRTLAWALDYPAVFTYGADDAEALLRMPQAVLRFENWLSLHTDDPWVDLDELVLHIAETFDVFSVPSGDEDYEVNAFFHADLAPLSAQDVKRASMIYTWQREELLAGVETLPTELLTREFEGQRWTIEGILRHIASVEFWYFSCLGFETELPPEGSSYLEWLTASEAMVNHLLPGLVGFDQIYELQQEKWSARKLVRRLLWHQRDHIDHIRELAFR